MSSRRKIIRIEEKLYSESVSVIYERMNDYSDAYYLTDGNNAYITIAPEITGRKLDAALAHEAGHHFSGLTGHKERDEERANRWAAKELISPEAIIQATRAGCQSYHELCEMLDLDEEFVRTAIKCFRSIYGEGVQLEDYYLHLHPIWIKDIKTGQVWPEE